MNEQKTSKVVITSTGEHLDAPVDLRFGRCRYLIVYDQEQGTFDTIDTRHISDMPSGAGVQMAQTVIQTGARDVITGNCGPKAFHVLQAAGIRIWRVDRPMLVRAALDLYHKGALKQLTAPDPGGYWI